MTDKSFKKALRPFKRKRRSRRRIELGMMAWFNTGGKFFELNCYLHPKHRWIKCDKKGHKFSRGWMVCSSHFCTGCYGNTCPLCGQQMRVKRRYK